MNQIFQLKLLPKSSFITPLKASTIWGHLAWNIFLTHGEEKGNAFLQAFQSKNPPFVLSDGFPEDYLPKPFTKSVFVKKEKNETIKFIEQSKVDKKQKFISLNGYGLDATLWGFPKKNIEMHTENILKIEGERATNQVKDGAIFSQAEIFPNLQHFSVYFQVFDLAFWETFAIEKTLQEIFETTGFGAKKSTGKGVFEVQWNNKFSFGITPKTQKSVILSDCILAEEEVELLQTARYRTITKYGKLGENFSHSKNPFKQPLVQLVAGSVLDTQKPFCGKTIQTAKEINAVEYAFGFLLNI